MSIIAWIVIGGLAGLIASALLRERDNVLTYVVIGIIGAFLGGYLFAHFGHARMTGFNLYSLGVAVAGSLVLILLLRVIRGGRGSLAR